MIHYNLFVPEFNWSLLEGSPLKQPFAVSSADSICPNVCPAVSWKQLAYAPRYLESSSSIPQLSNSSMNTWSECTSTEDRCPETKWSGFKCLFWKHSTWKGRHQLLLFAFFAPMTVHISWAASITPPSISHDLIEIIPNMFDGPAPSSTYIRYHLRCLPKL